MSDFSSKTLRRFLSKIKKLCRRQSMFSLLHALETYVNHYQFLISEDQRSITWFSALQKNEQNYRLSSGETLIHLGIRVPSRSNHSLYKAEKSSTETSFLNSTKLLNLAWNFSLTPLLQLQLFRCKFPKIRFWTYLPWIEFFKIWRKLLKFDSLQHYQYVISIFWSDKTWVDDFWPQFWRARYEI